MTTRDYPHDIPTVIHIVLHMGELVLKGRNRRFFVDALERRVRQTLSTCEIAKIDTDQGMMSVELARPYPWDDVRQLLSRVFGIVYISRAEKCPLSITAIEECVTKTIALRRFSSFAVRARRLWKGFDYSSRDMCVRIGALIGEKSGARVDLDHPEWTLDIAVYRDRVMVVTDRVKGFGGLPTGVSGRVVALMSGGIDSPVAAWRMIKRGCRPDYIHFHSAPFTSKESQEKVELLVEKMAQWQGPCDLAMVPFGEIQKVIVTSVPSQYRVILYRRFMIRIAERLAMERGCLALVTGDALGQVASQTLANMTTVESVTTMPILRPLIGMDKQEIVTCARMIDTFETSIEPHDDCCNFLMPPKPVTSTTPDELANVELALDVEGLVAQGLAGTTWKRIL